MNEKSSGSRSRKQRLTVLGTRCADHVTPLYPQKLALTSPTGGGRSVGIVRVRTKATEFSLVFYTFSTKQYWSVFYFNHFNKCILRLLLFFIKPTNAQYISLTYISQQSHCLIYTSTCFDTFMSSSGSLQPVPCSAFCIKTRGLIIIWRSLTLSFSF